ncbi:unnamed protein product, partial [Mesorhabditis spiculigera]
MSSDVSSSDDDDDEDDDDTSSGSDSDSSSSSSTTSSSSTSAAPSSVELDSDAELNASFAAVHFDETNSAPSSPPGPGIQEELEFPAIKFTQVERAWHSSRDRERVIQMIRNELTNTRTFFPRIRELIRLRLCQEHHLDDPLEMLKEWRFSIGLASPWSVRSEFDEVLGLFVDQHPQLVKADFDENLHQAFVDNFEAELKLHLQIERTAHGNGSSSSSTLVEEPITRPAIHINGVPKVNGVDHDPDDGYPGPPSEEETDEEEEEDPRRKATVQYVPTYVGYRRPIARRRPDRHFMVQQRQSGSEEDEDEDEENDEETSSLSDEEMVEDPGPVPEETVPHFVAPTDAMDYIEDPC